MRKSYFCLFIPKGADKIGNYTGATLIESLPALIQKAPKILNK